MSTLQIATRLAGIAITAVVVTFLVFAFSVGLRDPGIAILGESASAERIAEIRAELGLDRPVVVQYLDWLGGVAHGDLGLSIGAHQPIAALIARRFAPSIELAVLALGFAMVFGITLGIVSSIGRGRAMDYIVGSGSLLGIAIPDFVLGLLLILLVSIRWKLLPPSGFVSLTEDPVGNLRLMIMPAFALGLEFMAVVVRLTRSSFLEALRHPALVAARARGLSEVRVLTRYGLRLSLIPVVTWAGLRVGRLIGGAVIIETVFGIPGIGALAVNALFTADYLVVQAVVLVVALSVGLANLAADLVNAALDPRVRAA